MDREEILLKEYEVCQQDVNSSSTRYWTVVGIFLPLNTALLGWIIVWIIKTFEINMDYLWGLIFVLLLSIGMFAILLNLATWLERVNSFIRVNYYRMREIEKALGMRKNCIADVLDNHWDEISEEEQSKLQDLHDKHEKTKAADSFKRILYVLISFWGIVTLITFLVIAITIINYYS